MKDMYDGFLPEDDGFNREDAITAALEDEPREAAELIDMAIDALDKGIENHADWLRHMREARRCLLDIYQHDSQDPRANGWVDDRGRP